MKNFKFFAIFAIVAMVFAACTEKFGAKDNLMGWIWNGQTHAPEVINIDGDPVGRAETMPQLIAADTLQFQGNSGAEVEGQWSKSGISGMGDQVEFAFVYDGSKHSQITAQVALTLHFESEDVYALDKYTLRGTLREVSHEDAPFLQTSVASLVLTSESGDQVIRKDVVLMVGAMLRDTVIVHVHDTIHTHSTDTVVVHDTAYIYVHDSIVVHDTTIIRDTTTTVVHDSVINVTVRERRQWCLGWDQHPIFEAGEWRLYATDSLVEKTTVNGNVSYERKSFRHYDVYQIPDFSGNFDGSQEGNCFYFGANGTVNAGGQTVTCQWQGSVIVGQVFLHGENVTSTLDKHRSAPSRVCFNGGIATYYFRNMQNEEVADLDRNYTNTVQRQYLYSDTVWNCGTASGSYAGGIITYTINRTGTITHYYTATPTTEPGGTCSGTLTYIYNESHTGTLLSTMVGMRANVNNNSASLPGLSTSAIPGAQAGCPHVHDSIEAVNNGIKYYGTFNNTVTTVTVPVPMTTPTPFFPDATILDMFVVRCHTWQNDVTGTVETWAKVQRNSDNVIEYRYAIGYQNLTASSFTVETQAANNGTVTVNSSVISIIDTRISEDWWPVHVNVNQSATASTNPTWRLGVTHSDPISGNNNGYTTDAKDITLHDVCHVSMVNTTVGVGAGNSHIGRWNSTTGQVVAIDGSNTVYFTANN